MLVPTTAAGTRVHSARRARAGRGPRASRPAPAADAAGADGGAEKAAPHLSESVHSLTDTDTAPEIGSAASASTAEARGFGGAHLSPV